MRLLLTNNNEIRPRSGIKAVLDTLYNPNAAADMRFAGADRIYRAIETEVFNYLQQAFVNQTLPEDEEDRHRIRLQVAASLERKIQNIIASENNKPETLVPLLEQYQRDLGIYSKYENTPGR